MTTALGGFDWDRGNVSKCQKHGVSIAEIEALFGSGLLVLPDSAHSKAESRQWELARAKPDAGSLWCLPSGCGPGIE
jgi:uncharacterized protein